MPDIKKIRSLTQQKNTPRLPSPYEYSGDFEAWGDALILALQYEEPSEGYIWYPVSTNAVNGFENGYVAGNVIPEFRLDSAFNLYMRGELHKHDSEDALIPPVINDTLFTLPAGFRPAVNLKMIVWLKALTISTSGVITFAEGAGTNPILLDNIIFSADGE